MARTRTERDLSADQQIARMRDECSGFAVLFSTPWIMVWRGKLTPFACSYDVQLLYCSISLALACIKANTVHVEVVEPLLGRRPSQPDVSIPHLYPNRAMPMRPRLCLHRQAEWTPTMYIADTIVPWTIEWLAAYEGWRATGTWYAGGHNTERDRLSPRLGARR